jgi:hypothetical protein
MRKKAKAIPVIGRFTLVIKAIHEYNHLDYWFRQESTRHAMSKEQFIRNRLKKAGYEANV